MNPLSLLPLPHSRQLPAWINPRRAVILAALLLPIATPPAQAATYYWDINGATAGATDDVDGSASGNWAGSNWTTAQAGNATTGSVMGDSSGLITVVFSAGTSTGLATGVSTITLPGGSGSVISIGTLTIERGTLTFNSGGAVFWLRSATPLMLGPNADGSATFNANLGLSGIAPTQTWTNANTTAGRDLIINGTVLAANANFALTLANTSAGGTTVNGSLGVRDGNVTPTVSLTIANTGSGVTTLAGGNVYTGTTTVSAGTLVVSRDAVSTILANQTYSRNASTFTSTAGFANGDQVVFNNGAVPNTLTAGTVYYVVNASGNDFQLSSTLGGSAISLTGTQSSTANAISKAGALGSTNSAVVLGDASTGSNAVRLLTDGAYTVERALTVNNFGTGTTIGGNTDHNSIFSGAITLNKNANLQSVTTGGNSVTFSGVLSGAGGITKTGSGRVTLTQANPFTGNTVVNEGTLILSGSGAIAASPVVDIKLGATLNTSAVTGGTHTFGTGQTVQGRGTVIGDTVIQGTLAPGNSPGVLTFNDDLSLASTANSVFEIQNSVSPVRGTDYDGVNVGGLLSYDGALTLSLTGLVADGTYHLFDFGSFTGNFASVAFSGGIYAGTFLYDGSSWNATDTNGSGQIFSFTLANGELIVSAIPEPSTTALFLIAGMALLFFRHRSFGN